MNAEKSAYAWIVLAAAFAVISMGIGTLFSLSVFLTPIEEAMGWSRSGISAIAFFNWFIMGAGSLFWGNLSDRIGTRPVALMGGVLLGLGLALSGQVTALWQFYVTFGLLVGLGVSAFYVPLTSTVVQWFPASRGFAAAIVSSGNGFGLLVLSPLSRWLISTFDWRAAMLILGVVAWLIVVPAALLIRNRPHDVVRPASGAPAPVPDGGDFTSGTALRSFPLWVIAFTHFACCAAHSGPIFHMVSHAIDQGVAKMAAAGVLGVSGLSSIPGRMGLGILADRIGAKRILVVGLMAQAIMIFAFLFAHDLTSFYVLALFFGVTYGGVMPLYAVVTREYFGQKVMGTAYGAVFFISSVGMGVGSFAGGWFYDHLGSYTWLYGSSFAIGGMAALLAATLRPPRAARTSVGAPTIAR